MAEEFTQRNRPLRISTPLGTDVLLLERLRGVEHVSSLFRFTLDLLSEKSDVDPAALLGQLVTVEIDFAGETRYINGVVSRFVQRGRGVRLTRYRAEVVPTLWFATLVRNSRIFQSLGVPDILTQVLGNQGVPQKSQLTGRYRPRNYCSQYRETNFAFISRLMEEEGIFYLFKHDSGRHEMLLLDLSNQAPTIPASKSRIAVATEMELTKVSLEPRILRLEIENALVSGKVVLRDHHFQMPTSTLEAEQAVDQGHSAAEVYDYPGEYADRFDGIASSGSERPRDLGSVLDDNLRTAAIRARELGAAQRVLRGGSNYPLLTAGHLFEVERHYRGDVNGEYFLTSVEHSASVENYENSEGSPFQYTNTFTCIPSSVPYAPPRVTPRARVEGSQTALVVGPQGAEIHTDKYGRVKVQFHWDRDGKKNEDSSCWLRVSSPWTGKNWGMIAIPRVGSEVVVDFLEGDPDRPLITGMVYNPDTMPPYVLPENKTQSGIKSRSTPSATASNFNELRFEDKKGAEEVFLHAEKNLNTVVKNDETHRVGFEKKDKGDQSVEIFNNQKVSIGAGRTDASDGSQTVAIYKDQTVTLETGDQTITLKDGNQTITLQNGDRTLTLQHGNETISLNMGNRKVTLSNGNDSLILENGSVSKKLKTGNDTTELDLGNVSTKANVGSIKEEAMQGIEMKVGQNSIKIDQAGITIKGMMVTIEGQVQTQVKGLMTEVSASAMMTVKGGVTMIN